MGKALNLSQTGRVMVTTALMYFLFIAVAIALLLSFGRMGWYLFLATVIAFVALRWYTEWDRKNWRGFF